MRTVLVLLLVLTSSRADTIKVEPGADAVVVRSPMSEGNFLMRLPPGFAERKATDPWQVELESDGVRVRLRIELLPADRLGLDAEALAKPRAGKLTLEGKGGARRIGSGPGENGMRRLALYVRDGKRFYEVVVDLPEGAGDRGKKLRETLENFTLLNPQGAPEPAPEDPDALKSKTLQHDFYRIEMLKPKGFGERPPDVDGDRGIWKHLRRVDEDQNLCEIRVRSHLSLEFKKPAEQLAKENMERFASRYKDVRIPKRPKNWKVKGGKTGLQVQMSGRSTKTGLIVRVDYRCVEHENGRTYEFDMILWGNASRAFAKEVKAFWKSIRITGD